MLEAKRQFKLRNNIAERGLVKKVLLFCFLWKRFNMALYEKICNFLTAVCFRGRFRIFDLDEILDDLVKPV